MDEIRSSVVLEKNELMYLLDHHPAGRSNPYTARLTELTGVSVPDEKKAVASLTQKRIIQVTDSRMITIRLFDFLIKKILEAAYVEPTDTKRKGLVFYNEGIILLVEEHSLSDQYMSIRAFQSKEDMQKVRQNESIHC